MGANFPPPQKSRLFQGKSSLIRQPVCCFPARSLYAGVYTSGAGSVAAASDLGGQAQHTWYYVLPGVTSIQLVFGNTAFNTQSPSGEYTTGLSTITVGASVNSPKNTSSATGAWRDVTFNGGNLTVSIPPGGLVVSDPVPVVGVVGAPLWTRTWVQVPAGGSFPIGMVSNAFNVSGSAGGLPIAYDGSGCGDNYPQHNPYTNGQNTGADKRLVPGVAGDGSDGGTLWISTYGTNSYGPLNIIGSAGNNNVPVVGIIGDSNAEGLGDAWAELGIFQRALIAAGLTAIKLNFSGDSAYQFTPQVQRLQRQRLLEGCTHAICEHPSNDIGAGQTVAQCQASVLTIGNLCAQGGIPVWQTTLPPRTTTTNGWATAGGQTVLSTESVRLGFNAWVRGGMPINSSGVAVSVGTAGAITVGQSGHPFSGIFETGALIEVNASNVITLNGGFWYCGPSNNQAYTADGTHYSSLAAVIMQLGINCNVFVTRG